MNLIDEAAGLVTGPLLVNEKGYSDDPRLLGMVELICQSYGLHIGFVYPVMTHVITLSGVDTYRRLEKGGVLVCTARRCDKESWFWSNEMAVCEDHIGWTEETGCSCTALLKQVPGKHHSAACAMWSTTLTLEALDEWKEGHGKEASH